MVRYILKVVSGPDVLSLISVPRMKDSTGWHLIWTSEYLSSVVERVAINAKVVSSLQDNTQKMVAAAAACIVRLWSIADDGDSREIG